MTEHNHRRGTARGRDTRESYWALSAGHTRWWQRLTHRKRRMLVAKLLHAERADDIPGNTPKHIRWDYW